MQQTPNLNLKKPEGTDAVNIADLNANTDILDAEVVKLASTTTAGRMSAADKVKLDGASSVATASTLVQRDASGRFKSAPPVAADDVARKAEVDAHVFVAASTGAAGHVQLNSATNSTITTQAATPSAVKAAYDLANTAKGTADTALPKAGGEVTGTLTVSGNGGLSTAHKWATMSSSGGAEALYGSNCHLDVNDGTFRYKNTHGSVGARGIVFRWSTPGDVYWFDTGPIATVADQAFTPTLHKLITSAGRQTINGGFTVSDWLASRTFTSTFQIGPDGGRISLRKPASDTVLNGDYVTVNVHRNTFRVHEDAGLARGAYIDLTTCAPGAASHLWHSGNMPRVSVQVNAPAGPAVGDVWIDTST